MITRRRRNVAGTTAVIDGATSGLGRATALALARHGVRLALASRDAAALSEVAEECRRLGAEAFVIPTDVSDAGDVAALGRRAVETLGSVDAWINAAGVLVAGQLDETPVEALDRLIAVNVRGTLLSSRVALSIFRTQGHGVLVNVSSILGVVPNPMVPAYTMTKGAIRSLSLALRQRRDLPNVHVCAVVPGPLDTPLFDSAANFTGRQLRAVPPACGPERAAAAVISCIRRPRRQVAVGAVSRLILLGVRVAPRLTEWAVAQYSARMLMAKGAVPATMGDVFEPHGARRIDGGWRRGSTRRRLGAWFGRAASRAA
jgi:short-subunit dehydrogenase